MLRGMRTVNVSPRARTLARRFGFQFLLVGLTFFAAWVIFSSNSGPRGDFYVRASIDKNHVFRVYEFNSEHAGTLQASVKWDTSDRIQLRIADASGKTLTEQSGESPVEISTRARTNETYKLYVMGTKKDQETSFTLSAANSPLEIQDQTPLTDSTE